MFRTVACAISGGVDSSVAAYLLKQKGFDVCGIYMRNWDTVEEHDFCNADKDCEDAQNICKILQIPFMEVNFVKEYWNEVFSEFLESYELGMTSNPDIMCNKKIKFNTLFQHVTNKLGMDALATGHYVRTTFGDYLENFNEENGVFLKRGKDEWKDQSFFLSQVYQKPLQRSMFPLGNMYKPNVKKLAENIGLGKIAKKPESMGICFIGASNFRNFIQQYIDNKPGYFIDIETNEIIQEHKGFHLWTYGQRCKFPPQTSGQCCRFPSRPAWYIVKKITESNNILVAPGAHHPSLYAQRFITDVPHWIHSKPQQNLERYSCTFCFQHVNPLLPCYITEHHQGQLMITPETPLRALTPGQFAVFYDNDICLGSAKIIEIGPSLYNKENVHIGSNVFVNNLK